MTNPTTSADWPNDVDSNSAAATTTTTLPPNMVSSTTDLFDGELFGDELIDIYNSTIAEDHHGSVDANGTLMGVVMKWIFSALYLAN